MIRFLTMIGLLLCCASAQEEENVSVDLMSVCTESHVSFFYLNKGEVTRLEAFHSALGTPVFYRGPRRLFLYTSAEDALPRKDGEPRPKSQATAILPKDASRALLLFSRKGEKSGWSARAFGVNEGGLRGGDYRVFNLASFSAFGSMGGKAFRVKPGKITDRSSFEWRTRGEDLEVMFGLESEGKRKVVYSTIWGHYPQRRTYVLILPTGDASHPLEVRKYHDVPSVKSVGYEPEPKP